MCLPARPAWIPSCSPSCIGQEAGHICSAPFWASVNVSVTGGFFEFVRTCGHAGSSMGSSHLYNSSAGGTHCSSAHRHQRRRCAGCLHPDVNVCTPYCTKGLAVCTQLPPAAATQHLACICCVCAAAFPVRGPHAPASNFAQQILQQATFLRYHCYRTRWKEAAVPPSGPVCWQQALC